MYIVLLGAPGSGKGTQGGMISEKLGIAHLSTGDLFRGILSNPDHELYKDLQVIKEGKLVSDEIVNSVVEDGLRKPEYKDGVIFDGYPRTVAQAEALDKMLDAMGKKVDVVIDIQVTQEVLLERLLGRRSCPNCKRIFHIKDGIENCPDCNVPLVQRDDDNEETIRERFEEYRMKTAPLHNYYKNGNTNYIEVVVTDSEREATSVNQEIMDKLRELGLVEK